MELALGTALGNGAELGSPAVLMPGLIDPLVSGAIDTVADCTSETVKEVSGIDSPPVEITCGVDVAIAAVVGVSKAIMAALCVDTSEDPLEDLEVPLLPVSTMAVELGTTMDGKVAGPGQECG